jgi:hypothetical protein
MAACTVCGADLPAQRGPRARRYCSRACQARAYRARQEQRTGHRAAAADEQQLLEQYADVPTLQLGERLAVAARKVAGSLTAGQAADETGLRILARVPVVLAARARDAAITAKAAQRAREDADRELQAAMEEAYAEHAERKRALEDAALASLQGLQWHRQLGPGQPQSAPTASPTVTIPDLAAPPEPPVPPEVQPSRDDAVPAQPPAAARRPRRPAKTSRDDSAPAAESAPAGRGIEPRPQKLPKKKANAILEAAELVRDPEHRENHRWILRSGETVLGYVEPSYGGASRSGRNGWVGRLGGTPGDRRPTRNAAAENLAYSWFRLVTATPKRTITGSG